MTRLQGKTAIITGAARGTGRAFVDAVLATYEGKAPGQRKQEVGRAAVPYGRMGVASALAGVVVFLASEEAGYIVVQCYTSMVANG